MHGLERFHWVSEWGLDSDTFNGINKDFGPLQVDLCATRLNTKLPSYISPCVDDKALAVDILATDLSQWKRMYIFPPLKLIPKLIPLIKKYRQNLVLVAPNWQNQAWFPVLKKLLPTMVPLKGYALTQRTRHGLINHSQPNFYALHL